MLVLPEVELGVVLHLLNLVVANLVQQEVLRHVGVEAEVAGGRQQVLKCRVHNWK